MFVYYIRLFEYPPRCQIVQLFGFQGQRTESLDILYSVGGWSTTSDEPSVSEADEGTRRPITDVALLIFHLLISKYTYKGVDLSMVRPCHLYHYMYRACSRYISISRRRKSLIGTCNDILMYVPFFHLTTLCVWIYSEFLLGRILPGDPRPCLIMIVITETPLI